MACDDLLKRAGCLIKLSHKHFICNFESFTVAKGGYSHSSTEQRMIEKSNKSTAFKLSNNLTISFRTFAFSNPHFQLPN